MHIELQLSFFLSLRFSFQLTYKYSEVCERLTLNKSVNCPLRNMILAPLCVIFILAIFKTEIVLG